MKLTPIGELRTKLEVGDVISLFVTAGHRYFVADTVDAADGQYIGLLRLRIEGGGNYRIVGHNKRTSITLTSRPINSRTDHYTRVYVHGRLTYQEVTQT